MFKRLLGIAVFCGMATSVLAGDGRPVNLITYFLAPSAENHEGIEQLAIQYDAVILHEWSAGKIDEFRAANPQMICLLYKNGMGLHLRNDVEAVEMLSTFDAAHPNSEDWFQLDSSNERIHWDFDNSGSLDYAAMRPDNTDWQTHWATLAITDALDQGWDGLFADDLWTYRGVYGADSAYSSDAELNAAVASFLQAQQNLCHQYGLFLTGNIGWWTVNHDEVWRDYIAEMDAGMQEKFAPESTTSWHDQVVELAQAVVQRSNVVLVRYGLHDNTRRALYSLCTALMVTDGRRVYYCYADMGDPSRQPPYYPWYDRMEDLGSPMGDAIWNASEQYATREFRHGWVASNPAGTTQVVNLPTDRTWYDRDGNAVTSLTLDPYSGDFVCDQP